MQTAMPLSSLPLGCPARVVSIAAPDTLRRRLRQLGLSIDAAITPLFSNPWGDPVAYAIHGATIALRNCDAAQIMVVPSAEAR